VIIGSDDALMNMMGALENMPGKTVEEILMIAAGLRHPESLMAEQAQEVRAANKTAANPEPAYFPPVGEWPAEWPLGLQAPIGFPFHQYSGAPPQRVHVVRVPTEDWTAIPAYFRRGAWNGCPAAEYHVAALRSWRDRFGAELVAMSFDTMDLRVERRPQSRQEALDLAREHYIFCSETVGDGIGTLSNSAANLIQTMWWNFWWD
jgi:hypothetical protein